MLLGQLAVGRRLYRRTSSFPQTPRPLAPTGVAGLAIRRQDAAALCAAPAVPAPLLPGAAAACLSAVVTLPLCGCAAASAQRRRCCPYASPRSAAGGLRAERLRCRRAPLAPWPVQEEDWAPRTPSPCALCPMGCRKSGRGGDAARAAGVRGVRSTVAVGNRAADGGWIGTDARTSFKNDGASLL